MWNASGGGYRAHLRVATASNASLIVGSSGPRNRRPVRAWDPTDAALFDHSKTHLHDKAPQCRMHGSTQIRLLRVPRICRVRGKRVRTPRRGPTPGIADKHSPRQITASASLTSSAGSMMRQLSIGRSADILWTLPKHQPLEYRSDAQHLTGTPNSHSMWEYSLMFSAEQFLCCCSAQPEFPHQRIGSVIPLLTLMQPRAANAASVSSAQSPAPPIAAIHSSLAWHRDRCDSSVLPSPSSSCCSTPSTSSQSWCSLAAIAAVVECTTTDSAPPRTQAAFLTMPRPAMCGQANPTAWAIRCAAMRVARRP
ncbi:hypothetical protein ECC02_004433 [Trypanosoma cruzi]|uniref:Uncharacterized protein n=1 Tax=Trypanosoma cruzi TaxID=5693 RepID=A0A7J6Y756_TRYCR|nr:hypothetical protein ECC02_004433 [Trypanosoma cruzi]